jgi:hypothetical protein
MREWDIEVLYSFILRPNMYLGETTPKNISIFLLGYEISSKYECDFTTRLIDNLVSNFDLTKNKGLEGTLNEFSSIDEKWIEKFQEVAKSILIRVSDSNGQNIYLSIQRKKLIEILETIPLKIDLTWILNFTQKIRSISEWEGMNFSNRILTELVQIKEYFYYNYKEIDMGTFQIEQPIYNKLGEVIKELKNMG